VAALVGCAQHAKPSEPPASAATKPTPIRIRLRHDSAAERETRTQLERLLRKYDLSPWHFTRDVVIDDQAIPFSHPVLTLHTRHLRDDLLLLSTYIHEQGHWHLAARRSATNAAVAELERSIPELPVGFPDGAQSRRSSYEHLLVIALEQRGLRSLVGELRARQAMEFWATDHYRALYRYVLDHGAEISRVMDTHALWPGPTQAARTSKNQKIESRDGH